MSTQKNSSVKRLTILALLAALSVVIGLYKFPLFPAAPFLEFDFADTPILIGTLFLGAAPGLGILAAVSVIQAFLLGGSGVIGLIMHFIASGTMIVVVNAVWRRKRTNVRMILALVFGAVAMTLMMIPLNLLLTPIYTGAPREVVASMLIPFIIPFNVIKAGGNCILAGIIYRILIPFFKKSGLDE